MRIFFTIFFLITIIYGFSSTHGMRHKTKRRPVARRPIRKPIRKIRTRWYNCNFEFGYCGWRNDSTAEFQWYRTSNETPTDETGPRWDHTKAGVRGQGHYLYIETSVPRQNGDHARLISPALVEQGTYCLKFWHNMHGSDVKDLNVYIKGRKSKKLTTISHLSGPWSVGSNIRNLEGEDNDWWNQESVQFVVKEPVNIIFEGVRGKNYRGDIAIDDIALAKARCPRKSINCNFENNTCGWTQMSGDEFNWLPNRGKTQTRNTGPAHDHTLKTPNGRYLYIETSWPRVEGDKARLMSPRISCDKGATPVFNFWYHMNGPHIGPIKIYATRDTERIGNPLWEKNGHQGDKWHLGQVAIPESLSGRGFFKIVIEAERKDYQGDAAIDDVSLTGCRSGDASFGKLSSLTTPTTTTKPKTSKSTTTQPWLRDPGQTPILPGEIECNFDQSSMCAWRQDRADQFDWERNQGKTHSEKTGPASDHTTRKGWYLYIEASSPRKSGDKAIIRSPPILPSIITCVSFYYHMEGKEMGKLELLSAARGGHKFTKHWSKQGQQSKNDTDWQFAKVNVKESVPYELAFRATVGRGFYSDIAIDDIKVDPTPCEKVPTQSDNFSTSPTTTAETKVSSTESSKNDLDCAFTNGSLCGWTQVLSPTDEFNWTVSDERNTPSRQTGPLFDHTAGSSGGYAYIEASTPRYEGDRATITSPEYEVKKEMCFHFWYHMYGQGIGNLTLYRKAVNTGKLIPLWISGGDKGDQWLEGLVDLRKLGEMSLVFEATRGEFWRGDIAIDDFKLEEGKCATIDCDFEEGNCAWVQDYEHDDFNWTRNSGQTKSKNTGPDFDHTLKNENGTYLYIEASNPRQRYDKARLISRVIDPGVLSTKCLTFWFHSFGEHVGAINVYKKSATSNDTYFGSPLWVNAGNEGDQWVYAKINVHDEFPYQIVIEGVRGLDYLGDIGIDDIVMTNGACDPCCGQNKFKCGNNFCIPKSLHCNKIDDCGDGSDESFCSDGPPCGIPFAYAPIREPMKLPENVLHDEGPTITLSFPEEGEPIPTPKIKDSAPKIEDWQISLFKHPKHWFDKVPLDTGLYSEDLQLKLNMWRKPETFSVERKKRRAGTPSALLSSSRPGRESETLEENYDSIDLVELQKNEKKMADGEERLSNLEKEVLKKQLKKRKNLQASIGKHHKISHDQWTLTRPGRKHMKKLRSGRSKRSVKKIVGGIKTSQYNYPWQVAYYVTDSGTKSHYFCGAALIDRYWILTAAHCPHLGDVHNVVIGDYDLYKDENTEQEIIVDAIFVHDLYKFDEDLVGDIALIKLRYPAKQSKSVQPACLLKNDDERFEIGHVCVTTGWGRTDPNTPGIERYLRQTEMPIISNSQCKATFWSIYAIHDSYVCAGGTGGNSCRGDSGGPLLCKRNDQFYLVGITSWGDTRCKPNIPGVYTRVQSYNKWMDRIMSKQECEIP